MIRRSKCQNCQDRRIPVSGIVVNSEYGIGIVADIEGNCRFYDLIRAKKMAKVSSHNNRDIEAKFIVSPELKCKWRMLPTVAFEVSSDAFLGVT